MPERGAKTLRLLWQKKSIVMVRMVNHMVREDDQGAQCEERCGLSTRMKVGVLRLTW